MPLGPLDFTVKEIAYLSCLDLDFLTAFKKTDKQATRNQTLGHMQPDLFMCRDTFFFF